MPGNGDRLDRIEAALDHLTERHEALTQSLELMRSFQRDTEKQLAAGFSETTARFAETLQFINQLAHVAEAHEKRIEDLEQQH